MPFINVFRQHTQLHQDFVCAVFEVGLRHATPSAIIDLMIPNLDMTSERVKSHLQRCRLNIVKSCNEFKSKYAGKYYSTNNAEDKDSERYSSGAAPPASSLKEDNQLQMIYLPQLSAEEKDTPLGQAFVHLLGLMQCLTVQLENNRQKQAINSLAHTIATPQDLPVCHKYLPPTRLPSDLSITSLQQSVRRQTIESINPHKPHPYQMSLQQANSLTTPHGYATQLYHQHLQQHSAVDNFASSGQNLQLQNDVWQGAPPPLGNTMMPYQPSLTNQNFPMENVNFNIDHLSNSGNPSIISTEHSFHGPMGIVHHQGNHNNNRLSSSDPMPYQNFLMKNINFNIDRGGDE